MITYDGLVVIYLGKKNDKPLTLACRDVSMQLSAARTDFGWEICYCYLTKEAARQFNSIRWRNKRYNVDLCFRSDRPWGTHEMTCRFSIGRSYVSDTTYIRLENPLRRND